ncbi:MAG TPA: hypothetical protein VFB61_11650 [Gemmatimonadales bacterium]|nr:hypothetical protein [Gemmatimonadales bacterium]
MQLFKSSLSLLALVSVWSTLAPGAAQGQKAPKRERDIIAREELVQASEKFTDLYQTVRSLRPHFLTSNRGERTLGNSGSAGAVPVIYVDGRQSGGPDYLKGISAKDVAEVRYLNPNKAGMEYGLGHEGGAIVVKMFVKEKTP